MTARKPGLSIERHEEIGAELFRLADRLTELSIEIGNAYPKSSLVYRLALRPGAYSELYRLRAELENRMLAEYPQDPRAALNVYFPRRADGGRDNASRSG